MAEHLLGPEDWQRILKALSHFRHNPDFRETHDLVRKLLSDPDFPGNRIG